MTQQDYDELLADSLQVENYLNQLHHSHQLVIHLEIKQCLLPYLKRYREISPQVPFRIFLFSNFYGQKVERFLEDFRGDHYV